MIKCIIFDYGNVIAKSRSAKFRDALFKKHGINPAKVKEYWKHFNHPYELGEMTNVQFLNGLRKYVNQEVSIQELANLFFMSDEPEEEMIHVIRKLSGYFEITILSNSNPLLTQKIKHDGYFKHIRVKVFSDEIHIRKPDARAYQITLRDLRYHPDQCIFVDDREENIRMAVKLGIRSILYDGHPHILFDEIMKIHALEEKEDLIFKRLSHEHRFLGL